MRKIIAIIVILMGTQAVLIYAPGTSNIAQAANTSVRLHQSCTKRFKTSGKKLMCLPKARGTGLTWQKFPKQKTRCARLGVKVSSLKLECVRRTFSGSVRHAGLYWMPPPGPFVTRTIYGDEWQPKLGQECNVHQLTLEQSVFQGTLRGLYTTCLPTKDGVRWVWQNGYPKLNGGCARIGHAHGKLTCKKVGSRGVWKKAQSGSVSAELIVSEIKRFFARTKSDAMKDWVDQLQLFMFAGFAFETGALTELSDRASLAKVKLSQDNYGSGKFSISHGGITTCYLSPSQLGENIWNWWGSERSIQEIPCSLDASSAKTRVLGLLSNLETSLRQSNDVHLHSVNLMRLRNSIDSAYSFDPNIGDGVQNFTISWKYTLNSSNQVATSTYKVTTGLFNSDPSNCYAATWNGVTAQLSEVACA